MYHFRNILQGNEGTSLFANVFIMVLFPNFFKTALVHGDVRCKDWFVSGFFGGFLGFFCQQCLGTLQYSL